MDPLQVFRRLLSEPLSRLPVELPLPGGGEVRATWLGTAGVHLQEEKGGLLIDPFVTRPPARRVFTGLPISPDLARVRRTLDRLGRVDVVFTTHTHFDHALDAAVFAREAGALLVGTESLLQIGRGAGLPETQLVQTSGAPLSVGGFEVVPIPSLHQRLGPRGVPFPGPILAPLVPPAPASAWRVGEVLAFSVRHRAGDLLHLGSPAFLVEALAALPRPPVVLLALGGRRDDPALLGALVAATHARRIVPIHHDNFLFSLDAPLRPMPGLDFAGFLDTARSCGLEVRSLPLWAPCDPFGV